MATILNETQLHHKSPGSDKVYCIAVMEEDDGSYSTAFCYGKRNATLSQVGFKAKHTIYAKAIAAYTKQITKELTRSDTPYVEAPGVCGDPLAHLAVKSTVAASVPFIPSPSKPAVELERTGIAVQLLNPIDDADLHKYLTDPRYAAQEKRNGERRPACLKDGEFYTSNRKGFKQSCPVPVADALSKAGISSFVVDGELIGDIYFAFDLLYASGKDYTGASFFSRFKTLTTLFASATGKHFSIIPLALSSFDKTALYERLLREEREGIVFIELASVYEPGKPASGGTRMKKRFVEAAQVIVTSVNAKRSVAIHVIENGRQISVGNVTIPPNASIPALGEILSVEYLYYFGEGGSLFQPVYEGVRTDIDHEDCTLVQLKRAPLDMAA
jgi:bifunctional non-homologous end joining protein LigD